MNGTLFVIEGVDGSGKATQTKRLLEALLHKGYPVRKVEFPDYDSSSSSLIKLYLGGAFGACPDDVNAYVASTFYAVDRFASFRQHWQEFYQNGGIILADRYTTSNMIHQGGKISDTAEKKAYLDWLTHFEYGLFQLPAPNDVFFLDMPPQFSRQLREQRNQLKADLQQDIHEADESYLDTAYQASLGIAKEQGWIIISCVKDNEIRSVEEIHHEILDKIEHSLGSY